MKFKSLGLLLTAFAVLSSITSLTANEESSRIENEQLSPLEIAKVEEERFEEIPEDAKALMMSLWSDNVDFYDESFLNRVHKSANRFPVAVSVYNADAIQLDDASKWSVHPYYRDMIRYWTQNDVIFVKPKSSWFSMYSYVLQNRTRQQIAEVNFTNFESYAPAVTCARWITKIDPYKNLIELNDKSVWQVSQSDSTIFPKYNIGNRVIIGVNNYWKMNQHPHILINASLYNTPYVEAEFLGYEAQY